MEYKVGQVFYLVGSETAKVIPFRVVEEVTRTTLDGVEKTFIAEVPDKKNTKVPVTKLKGETFTNLQDLRKHMIENAANAIDNMIARAEHLAEASFGFSEQKDKSAISEVLKENNDEYSVQEKEESDKVSVDIGNGIIARMNLKDLEKVSQI
jgi:hypothetical protein